MAEVCDSLAFLDANYDEAMSLAQEARDYLAVERDGQRPAGAPLERMAISCAALKVTSRLTQVMAWLLVQKAVQSGEMTRAEAAREPFRLSGQDVCLSPGPLGDHELPPALSDIQDRSLRLYERVMRLDAMLDRAIAG